MKSICVLGDYEKLNKHKCRYGLRCIQNRCIAYTHPHIFYIRVHSSKWLRLQLITIFLWVLWLCVMWKRLSQLILYMPPSKVKKTIAQWPSLQYGIYTFCDATFIAMFCWISFVGKRSLFWKWFTTKVWWWWWWHWCWCSHC